MLWSVGDKVSVFYEVNGETGSTESEALTAENIKADGKVIYSDKYGLAPETLEVPSGNCSVSIRSSETFRPGFS